MDRFEAARRYTRERPAKSLVLSRRCGRLTVVPGSAGVSPARSIKERGAGRRRAGHSPKARE